MLLLYLLSLLGLSLADTGRLCGSRGECPAGWRKVGGEECLLFMSGWEEDSAREVCRGLRAQYEEWVMTREESDSATRHSLPVCLLRIEPPGKEAAYTTFSLLNELYQLTDSGGNGCPGVAAQRPVVEEIRPGSGTVILLLQLMGENIARGTVLNPGSVTTTHVS